MRVFFVSVAISLVFNDLFWYVDMFILYTIRFFLTIKIQSIIILHAIINTNQQVSRHNPSDSSITSHRSIQSTNFRIFMTPYNMTIYSPSGEFIHSSDTIDLPFKTTVWWVHILLIPIFQPTFATSIPYTIRYLLQSYNIAICTPHQARP